MAECAMASLLDCELAEGRHWVSLTVKHLPPVPVTAGIQKKVVLNRISSI